MFSINRRDFIIAGLGTIGILAAGGGMYLKHDKFGRSPKGSRLQRILNSPNYRNGQFHCLEPVENIMENEGSEGESKFTATLKFLFGDKTGLVPDEAMISARTPLSLLKPTDDAVIWMGHSTFFLQLNGKKILIDPVFSSYASPLFFINKAFPGSNVYDAADFPEIDALLISHDHWDHLDYPSIMALKDKVKDIVCPLGVGEYFEQWGFDSAQLHEEDWFTEIALPDGLAVHILPSQHFSGRLLKQNQTLWCSFAVVSHGRKIFCSGDGGYGRHFKKIGEQFHGFDLAIMENGQYNKQWHRIHLLPEETAQAAADLGAKAVIPSHNGKFALARHTWNEPYMALTAASKNKSYSLWTPAIGEAVFLKQPQQQFSSWWEQMV